MHCLDCSVTNAATAAVGTCVHCGAGVCREHLRIGTKEMPQPSSPGTSRSRLTRALSCHTCATP